MKLGNRKHHFKNRKHEILVWTFLLQKDFEEGYLLETIVLYCIENEVYLLSKRSQFHSTSSMVAPRLL